MKHINEVLFQDELLDDLHNGFRRAKPYKHIVFENFLSPDSAILLNQEFPPLNSMRKSYKGLNEKKTEDSSFDLLHPSFGELRAELDSSEFRLIVERISGIQNCFSTDDAMGAGLHQGENGSFLDIHIDFNIHHEKEIYRRLNLLIFLNKDWDTKWGGETEMWDANMTHCEQSYAPLFNRALLFETNEISYHGYSAIHVPEGVTRKSFFCYYYTKDHPNPVKYHDTMFKSKPSDSNLKKVKTRFKEQVKNYIKSQLKRFGVKY